MLASAVGWSDILRPRGVPLPEILHADLTLSVFPFAYLILERLGGSDLELVYAQLSSEEKQGLATAVVRLQENVSTLPLGSGFGENPSVAATFVHRSWAEVIDSMIARCSSRWQSRSRIGHAQLERVTTAAEVLESYFLRILPRAFLPDTTTKNVLVNEGRFSGIVDVDTLCFGDHLLPLALTRAACTIVNFDDVYPVAWERLLSLDEEQSTALSFYTALFCLDILSEAGHHFNRSTPIVFSADQTQRLHHLVDDQLQRII